MFIWVIKRMPYLEKYEQMEQGVDISGYLKLLSDEQREAIHLKYYLDMDYKTMSEILEIPLGTVKSRISLGLKKLKERLEGEYHG